MSWEALLICDRCYFMLRGPVLPVRILSPIETSECALCRDEGEHDIYYRLFLSSPEQ